MSYVFELDNEPNGVRFGAFCGPDGQPMAQVSINSSEEGWAWIPAEALDRLCTMWLAHREKSRKPGSYGRCDRCGDTHACPIPVLVPAPEPEWHKGCTWCWRTPWHQTGPGACGQADCQHAPDGGNHPAAGGS